MLKESCDRYRKFQRYSQLIGIALQLIAIVGGASAGLLPAGADVVEGLSVKDVGDYAFGLSGSLAEGEMTSLGERVFGTAAQVLSRENVEKMNPKDLRLLEDAVDACGLNLAELRGLFMQRSSNDNPIRIEEVDTEHVTGLGANTAPEILDTSDFASSGALLSTVELHPSLISVQRPSELKSVELVGAVIERLEHMEIATLWEAYVVRHKDNEMDTFVNFRDRMCRLLEAEDIDGPVLVDRNLRSSASVAKRIVDGLKKDGGRDVSFGMEVRLEQFLNALT